MKFKLDENLPVELASDLAKVGHEAETVVQEDMAGLADSYLLEVARREDRVLMTLDKGIANIPHVPTWVVCRDRAGPAGLHGPRRGAPLRERPS